jgi:GWxTD domain-containing protein
MSLSGLTSRLLIGVLAGACLSSHADQQGVGRSDAGARQRTPNPSRNHNNAHPNYYEDWLDEDVRWIISPEERAAFHQLASDEARDQFIEAFWQRRDPTPDTLENEFKQEHYRRILYANEHFAAGAVPGWETDRGHIYIVYGPADQIENNTKGAEARTEPGVIQQVNVLLRPPRPRFKDLEEAVVAHRIVTNPLPFSLQNDSVKLTEATSLVRVTIAVRDDDLALVAYHGGGLDSLNVYGRVVASSGRVMDSFEGNLRIDMPKNSAHGTSTYVTAIPLRKGRYHLGVAVQDVSGGRVSVGSCKLIVP